MKSIIPKEVKCQAELHTEISNRFCIEQVVSKEWRIIVNIDFVSSGSFEGLSKEDVERLIVNKLLDPIVL